MPAVTYSMSRSVKERSFSMACPRLEPTVAEICPMERMAWRAVVALTSVTYSLLPGGGRIWMMRETERKNNNEKTPHLSSSMMAEEFCSVAIFTRIIILALFMYEVSLKLKKG